MVAERFISRNGDLCDLGYKLKITKEVSKDTYFIEISPESGECPKPLTNKEFIDTPKEYEREVKNAKET